MAVYVCDVFMLLLQALSFLRLISLSPAQLLVVQAVSDKDKEVNGEIIFCS